MDITFLGTGGGRFVTLTQRRYTGGIWLDFGEKILLDPGPGSLIRALQFHKNPATLDAVFVSHQHLDHYSDVEVIIEAMTNGGKKQNGLLVIPKNTLEYVSDYHQKIIETKIPHADERFKIKNLEVEALPTYEHADGFGFKFFTKEGDVTYTSDTAYSDELIKHYKNSKILILNVIFPEHKEIGTHLNTRYALKIIQQVKPELAVITHFGMQMLNANPENEAKWIEGQCGVKTIAVRDGQVISLVENTKGQKTIEEF